MLILAFPAPCASTHTQKPDHHPTPPPHPHQQPVFGPPRGPNGEELPAAMVAGRLDTVFGGAPVPAPRAASPPRPAAAPAAPAAAPVADAAPAAAASNGEQHVSVSTAAVEPEAPAAAAVTPVPAAAAPPAAPAPAVAPVEVKPPMGGGSAMGRQPQPGSVAARVRQWQ